MKLGVDFRSIAAAHLLRYAGACGWTLARAHARSGDPCALAGYLGRSDAFERAVVRFAHAYADLAESDYDEFVRRVKADPSGRSTAIAK